MGKMEKVFRIACYGGWVGAKQRFPHSVRERRELHHYLYGEGHDIFSE
jgi:hypothetical protein